MTTTISECPICGEEIQLTKEAWMSSVKLDATCSKVVDEGEDTGGDVMRVYCKNEHTLEAMQERHKLCTREELDAQYEAAIGQGSRASAIHIKQVLAGEEDPDEWLIDWIAEEREYLILPKEDGDGHLKDATESFEDWMDGWAAAVASGQSSISRAEAERRWRRQSRNKSD